MNDYQSGVAEIFRRATDDLAAPVDELVIGGVTRGRALRRRHRAGTAVAAMAVFGVIGVMATVVPSLIDRADPAGLGGPAAQSSAPPSKTAEQPETPTPGWPRAGAPELTVAAANIPAAVAHIVGRDGLGATRTDALYPLVDERFEKIVHFYWEGTVTSLLIEPVGIADAADCKAFAAEGSECAALLNGKLATSFESTADQVTARGVTVWSGSGYRVSVLSYNAPGGKDVAPIMAKPPLSWGELQRIASSNAWYE